MKNRLVFLESEDEAELYLSRREKEGQNGEPDSVVILSQGLRSQFEKQKLPCMSTLSFFDNHAHERALEQSEHWLRLIESGLNPGNVLHRELIFQIRFILNYLLWTMEVIVSAVESLNPDSICCPPAEPCFGEGAKLSASDRYLGAVVAEFAREREIPVEFLDEDSTCLSKDSETEAGDKYSHLADAGSDSILSRWVRWNYRLLSGRHKFALAASADYGMDRAMKKKENVPVGLTPMFLDLSPEAGTMKDIIGIVLGLAKNWILPGNGKYFKSLPALHFPACGARRKKTQELEETILNLADRIEGEWESAFCYQGVSLAWLPAAKLRGGIRARLLKLSQDSARLHTALKTLRPAVVLSPFSVGHAALLGDLCRKMKIPAVLIPHGSLLPPKNQWEEIEWRRLSHAQMLSPFTFIAAQTPPAAKHADYYQASQPVWKTGPVLFAQSEREKGDNLRRTLKIPDDTGVIVYAVAQRKRSSIRFYIFETEDEYFSSLNDIVQAVDRMDKTHLIIKLHPSCSFSKDQIRRFLPESQKVSILHQEPFSDVLAAGDLLVSHISTTIEEALLNRTPVVLYDKWKRFSFFEALNGSCIEAGRGSAAAGYYVDDPGLLSRVFRFALDHARQASGDDSLYVPFNIPEAERKSLGYRLKKIVFPAGRQD